MKTHSRRHLLGAITALAVASVVLLPLHSALAGPNFYDWSYRTKITFEGYSKRSGLSNFPVLVMLDTNLAGFAYSQFASTNGGDLRFSDSSGTNELTFELEEWSTNGGVWAWVEIPLLDSSNDYIYAYWGNSVETNLPAYTSNGDTWDSDFRGVWHLDHVGGVEDLNDSTAANRHLSDTRAPF